MRSLAVEHVIEANGLEPRVVHDLHGDALLRIRLGVRVREHEALPRRAVREVEEVVDVAVNHDDGVALARDQVSVPLGHLLRHVEAQEQVRLVWLPRTGLRPRSPPCLPCLRPSLPPAAPEQRSAPCAVRSDRSRRNFRRQRNRRSSTHRCRPLDASPAAKSSCAFSARYSSRPSIAATHRPGVQHLPSQPSHLFSGPC